MVGAQAQSWVGGLLLPDGVWLSVATTLAYGYAYGGEPPAHRGIGRE